MLAESQPESRAVCTIQGVTIVLPHVAKVTSIEKTGIRFAWAVMINGDGHWLSFATKEDAESARKEFVQALTDYWYPANNS